MVGFVTDGTISKPSDLEGKTVGIQSNSTANYWFDKFVAHHKLDKSKIKVLDAKFAQLVPAFAQGKANAIIHFEPNVAKAVASVKGAKVTWWGGDDGLLPFYGYVAAGPKVYENKDTALRVLRGLRETSAYMKSHEAEVVKFAMDLTGMTDEKQVREILAEIDFDLAFDPNSIDQIQQISDYQLERGNIKAAWTPRASSRRPGSRSRRSDGPRGGGRGPPPRGAPPSGTRPSGTPPFSDVEGAPVEIGISHLPPRPPGHCAWPR